MGRNLFFLFAILYTLLFIPVGLNQKALVKSDSLNIDYSEAINNSTDDAVLALLTPTSNDSNEKMSYGNASDFQEIDLNLKNGLDRFKQSLYLNLNIESDISKQIELLKDIPIIIATGYDGYYIYSWQELRTDGKVNVINKWGDKKAYSTLDKEDNIIISYTLNDYVYIKNLTTGIKSEGDRKLFATQYPNYFNDTHFTKTKTQIINQIMQGNLESYTYSYNKIAKNHNWQLKFNTPLWGDRAINTVSFIAFMQGKLTTGAPVEYNSFGFGTAKITKKDKIYGYTSNNGDKLYSSDSSNKNSLIFDDPTSAANAGYEPDPEKFYANSIIPENNNVIFNVINNAGIPLIQLINNMDFSKNYIINLNNVNTLVTKNDINNDGTIISIPRSATKTVSMSFADIKPLNFVCANNIDQLINSGDTPPEITILDVSKDNVQLDNTNYKISFQIRDLDLGDNIKLIYKVVDLETLRPLIDYPVSSNVLDISKNNINVISNGKINSLVGYINTPNNSSYRVQVWGVDQSNQESQIAYFDIGK